MCANCGMVCTVYLLNMFHRRLILLDFLNNQIKCLTSVIVLSFTLYLFPFLLFLPSISTTHLFQFPQKIKIKHIYFNLFIYLFIVLDPN